MILTKIPDIWQVGDLSLRWSPDMDRYKTFYEVEHRNDSERNQS